MEQLLPKNPSGQSTTGWGTGVGVGMPPCASLGLGMKTRRKMKALMIQQERGCEEDICNIMEHNYKWSVLQTLRAYSVHEQSWTMWRKTGCYVMGSLASGENGPVNLFVDELA